MLNARTLGLVAGAFLGVACILFIVSNATTSWGVVKVDGITVATFGLWKACSKSMCAPFPSSCSAIEEKTAISLCKQLMAAQAFIIIACIISAFGALSLLFVGITNGSSRVAVMVGKGLTSAALVAGIIGLALGISFIANEDGHKLGAAAIVAIVGAIMSLFGVFAAVPIQPEWIETRHIKLKPSSETRSS